MKKLSKEEIDRKIRALSAGWVLPQRDPYGKNNFINREFVFENFIKAFAFMTAVAIVAEKVDHHPNWQNVYNKVSISLSTHDAGGITGRDFSLAAEIDSIFKD